VVHRWIWIGARHQDELGNQSLDNYPPSKWFSLLTSGNETLKNEVRIESYALKNMIEIRGR